MIGNMLPFTDHTSNAKVLVVVYSFLLKEKKNQVSPQAENEADVFGWLC